jgi:hypothetical protein
MPPQLGPASTLSRTSLARKGILIIVSSATTVVGDRVGARDSKVGKATVDDVDEALEERRDDLGGVSLPSSFPI